MNPELLERCKVVVRDAIAKLKSLNKSPKIFVKIARNLGDSLHGTPIFRHYKTKYPDCAIAFLTESRYLNAHELNKDIDVLMGLPDNLDPQVRIQLKRYIDERVQEIDFVLCPAVFPFGEVWASHRWSFPLINHQYYVNALIKLEEMQGDKKLHAPVSEEDLQYAERFVGGNSLIAMEYNSYSHTPAWGVKEFTIFSSLANKAGYKTVSFASKKEGIINGSIDGRGIDWRKTIAILSKCKAIVGIGSGITMLAGCATPIPLILEIGVSTSIDMKSMGYSDTAIRFDKIPNPDQVISTIRGN